MKKRLPQLDGLKVIMSFWIVLFHYSAMFTHTINQLPFSSTPLFSSLLKYGKYCVEVFFVISGFLIAHTYKEKIKHISFTHFIIGRLKTLYWSVALSVLLGIFDKFLSTFLLGKSNKLNFWSIFSSLTLTSSGWIENVLPYGATSWYIGVLIICYIIYFMISQVSKKKSSTYIPLCTILIFVGWICISQNYHFPFLYNANGRGYCCFFMGVLLFEFQKSNYFNTKTLSYLGLLILIILSALSYLFGINRTFGNFDLAIALFVAPTIVLITINIKWIQDIFSINLLLNLSKISTSLYLTHASVMSIIYTLNKYFKFGYKSSDPKYFFANILIAYVVAIVWHCIIEKRLIPTLTSTIRKYIIQDNL